MPWLNENKILIVNLVLKIMFYCCCIVLSSADVCKKKQGPEERDFIYYQSHAKIREF